MSDVSDDSGFSLNRDFKYYNPYAYDKINQNTEDSPGDLRRLAITR